MCELMCDSILKTAIRTVQFIIYFLCSIRNISSTLALYAAAFQVVGLTTTNGFWGGRTTMSTPFLQLSHPI